MEGDPVKFAGTGCVGCCCLLSLITLIVILTNIYNLGAEDQVVVETKHGRYVVNGPANELLNPFRHKYERKATRLGPREYAVVRDEWSGRIRHEEGPQLLFLKAWDEMLGTKSKIVLQRMDYIRMVDKSTGYERVKTGPDVFTPGPMDEAPNGTEQAIIIAPDVAVITLNRTDGTRRKIEDQGPFFPQAYEEIIDVRKAIVIAVDEYITIYNIMTRKPENIAGPDQHRLGEWSALNCTGATPPGCTRKKLVLQQNQFVRLTDVIRGTERVLSGPASVVPSATEVSHAGIEQSVYVMPNTTVQLANNTHVMVYPSDDRPMQQPKGLFVPVPYETVTQVKAATVLDARQYAIIETPEGRYEHKQGPLLLRLTAREKLIDIKQKILLRRDEWVRLVDLKTGQEEIEVGPKTFVPKPTQLERGSDGQVIDPEVKKAVFLDSDRAVLVLDKKTGLQDLIQAENASGNVNKTSYFPFVPKEYQYIEENRTKNRVLPYQAMAYKEASGNLVIKNKGEHFFLPAYASMYVMQWSSYDKVGAGSGAKVAVHAIDLRVKQIFFEYQVRTNDNVRLLLAGSIFWQINDTRKMISNTADPPGDVYQHARSAMIKTVSAVPYSFLTQHLKNVSDEAYNAQMPPGDTFYEERGIVFQQMEVTSFDIVDPHIKMKLEDTVQETVNRINALRIQQYALEKQTLVLSNRKIIETSRTELIEQQGNNSKTRARYQGERLGIMNVQAAVTFLQGLNETVSTEAGRIELYKIRKDVQARNKHTRLISDMGATLFLPPSDLNMQLDSFAR